MRDLSKCHLEPTLGVSLLAYADGLLGRAGIKVLYAHEVVSVRDRRNYLTRIDDLEDLLRLLLCLHELVHGLVILGRHLLLGQRRRQLAGKLEILLFGGSHRCVRLLVAGRRRVALLLGGHLSQRFQSLFRVRKAFDLRWASIGIGEHLLIGALN